MARRKIKIDKNRTLDVICPMSFCVDVEAGSGFMQCDANCAWFSIVGDSAFCKEAEIGDLDEADDN